MPITGQGMLLMDITILVMAGVCVLTSLTALFHHMYRNGRNTILALLNILAWSCIAGRTGWWLWNFQDAPLSVPFGIALLALCASTLIVMYPKSKATQ